MPPWLQALLVGGGIWAVLQAQISGWWMRKKTDGEGRQASGAGTKSLAEGGVLDTDARIKEWKEINAAVDEARNAAEKARDACRKCLLESLGALEGVLDAIERVLNSETDPDPADLIHELRVIVRTGRRAVWELRP